MAGRKLTVFANLLARYPREKNAYGQPVVDMDPCSQGRTANPPWNQCAIRVSIALIGAGFALSGYSEGPKCQHGHARGAQSLGDYLWKQVGRPLISKPGSTGRTAVGGKTGIIVFKDISGFRGGQGDHIDLWNRTVTMTGEYFDRARETWFWAAS